MNSALKLEHRHAGRRIVIPPGGVQGLRPGDLGVCAIGGGAEGWAVVHVGPRGDVADLGGDLYFGTHEEALSFAKELIDLWQAQQPGPSPE
ncbi:MAG: hypothetical protein E6Q92_01805 [Burkholderiaceae bacterium]|nr:MAG: hypothetical protein E6Q92_01805 [Burkholderiaceae bacterium]